MEDSLPFHKKNKEKHKFDFSNIKMDEKGI
jgi:hypothetical protein